MLTPEDTTLHRHLIVIVVDIVAAFGYAKVRDLADTLHVDQDIVRFQIAMQDATLVDVG